MVKECLLIIGIAIFFSSRVYANNLSEIEEVKALLAEQNKILLQQSKNLLQQKQTIEKIQKQNARLHKVIEGFPEYITTANIDKPLPVQSFGYQTPSEPKWGFSFTPRTVLRISTLHDISLNDGSYAEVIEEPLIWANGATISATSPWLPDTTFLFTGLYGFDSTKKNIVATQPIPGSPLGLATSAHINTDVELYHFDLIARTQIPGTNANWLLGFEYVGFRFEDNIISGTPIFNGGTKRNDEIDIYNFGLGLGGFFNLSNDGTHRIFSNVLFLASLNKVSTSLGGSETWWGGGLDVNVGYEWMVNDSFSISPRYRGEFLYFNTEDNGFNDQSFLLHGPELHFIFRFD